LLFPPKLLEWEELKVAQIKLIIAQKEMKIINLIQIIVSVLLMISILLQNRGAGLSSTFGGDFGGYYTKRGVEKFLFYLSIGLSAAFLALAITSFILASRQV
jgi:protein translocase SecG subunit